MAMGAFYRGGQLGGTVQVFLCLSPDLCELKDVYMDGRPAGGRILTTQKTHELPVRLSLGELRFGICLVAVRASRVGSLRLGVIPSEQE